MSDSDVYWEDCSPLQGQIDFAFEAWCDVCSAEFLEISYEYDTDFLAWVKRETVSAKRHGWTETKSEVFCPNCDENDFLAKLERKKFSDSRKVKEAVLAATRKTWAQRLVRFVQNKFP